MPPTHTAVIDGSIGCLILSGVPGDGKTTVAGLVAGCLPRSAVLGADAVARMVRSGWVGLWASRPRRPVPS